MLRRYRLLAPDTGSNPTGGEPQVGDPAVSTSAPGGQTTTSEPLAGDEQISLEEAKKLRSEANATRKREKDALAQLKVYQDKEQQAKDAQLPEMERLQKQLTDTQAQLGEKERANQERVIRYEVQLQAAALGVDPLYLDKIARLIDRNEIKTDDEGMPTNVKELLDKLVKEMPALVLQQQKPATSTAGGATNPSRTTASTTGLSWEVITKMTGEQYDARRQEIMQWMQKNPPKRF